MKRLRSSRVIIPKRPSWSTLRFFGGYRHGEAADVLGISRRQADGLWVLAKTWLFEQLTDEEN